jgi:hypothetical protein
VGGTRAATRRISPDARRGPRFPGPWRRPRYHARTNAAAGQRSKGTRTRPPSRRTHYLPLMTHRVAARAEADLDDGSQVGGSVCEERP